MKVLRFVLPKVVFVCAIWELVALFAPVQAAVPHFWQISSSIQSFARFGDPSGNPLAIGTMVLAGESVRSLLRASLGLCIGAAIEYVVGAAALLLPGWQAIPVKLVASLRAVPPLALVFLLVFISPIGEAAAIGYVTICVSLFVSGALHDTRHYLPEQLLQQVHLLGGRRWHQLKDVAAPAMRGQTKQTCAWICQLLLPLTFGAELISSQSGGLGALGYQAFIYSNLAQLMTLAAIYIVLGHVLTFAVSLVLTPNPIQIAPSS